MRAKYPIKAVQGFTEEEATWVIGRIEEGDPSVNPFPAHTGPNKSIGSRSTKDPVPIDSTPPRYFRRVKEALPEGGWSWKAIDVEDSSRFIISGVVHHD